MNGGARRVVLTADDFGLSEAVNEGIERAYRDGALTHASLMVAGDAAADAVRRARRLPELRVGLHLVAIEGRAVLPPVEIPALVDARGWFPSDALRLGLRYAFRAARYAASSRPRSPRSSPLSPPPACRSTMPTRTSTCICTRPSGG